MTSPPLSGVDPSQPIRVAVTGVNGDAGLGTIKGLRAGARDGLHVWILGMDYFEDGPGFHRVERPQRVPGVVDPRYPDDLIGHLRRHRIRVLFPGVDAEIPVLARLRPRIESETGCRVLVEDPELVDRACDKLETARWLEELGLGTPRTVPVGLPVAETLERVGLPAIAKPRSGHGSIGLSTLRTRAELEAHLADPSRADDCIQQLVLGPEYTCGLLFDGGGALRDAIAMRRLLRLGRTVEAETESVAAIEAYLAAFGERVRATGAINLQLRLDGEGRPLVFEINPRLSGSTGMRVAVGFNDPLRLLCHHVLGEPIERADVLAAKVFRVSDELVVPK